MNNGHVSSGWVGSAAASLADAFDALTSRLQAGEPVGLEEMRRLYPAHAEELARLLPALAALGDLSGSGAPGPAPPGDRGDGWVPRDLGDFRIVHVRGRRRRHHQGRQAARGRGHIHQRHAQGDGLSVVRFDDTSQILMPVTDVGPTMTGMGRMAALGHIKGPEIDPAGSTSIGAGVVSGKQTLDDAQAAASPHYDVTAMIVLTDGMENTPPFLNTVGGSITANTFAIGLGLPENISVEALNTLTQGHNGYLLVTGMLTPDQSQRLSKYFVQALAGVTNANVVLDPHGVLTFGAEHHIPFFVAETDMGMDVFLLCPSPGAVDFRLQTPDGNEITPATAGASTNIEYVQVERLGYYRLSLPAVPGNEAGTHAGLWHAILRLRREDKRASGSAVVQGSLPYDLVVHCYSNLVFKAYARQTQFEPGAEVSVFASLREYEVPVDHRAKTWAEVTRPDGSTFTLLLDETEAGRYQGRFTTTISGLYTIRVRALGQTFRGIPFQREQTLSAAVYPGADHPPQPGGDGERFWCEFLRCLLSEHVLGRKLIAELQAKGIDLTELARCLEKICRDSRGGIREGLRDTPPTSPRVTPALTEDTLRRVARAIINELGDP
jgi:hypothetical protein